MCNIIITGVPGTGKTIIGERLAKILEYPFLKLGDVALSKKFVKKYDEQLQTWIIDINKLKKYINSFLRKTSTCYVIECIYCDVIDAQLISKIIVLRTHPLILRERLSSRGWPERKINENVLAEALGTITYDMIAVFPHKKIFEVDTTNLNIDKCIKILHSIIKNNENFLVKYYAGRIDWLNDERVLNIIEKI